VWRGLSGWQWDFPDGAFISLAAGLTVPSGAKSKTDVHGELHTGNAENDAAVNEMLQDMRTKKESELESQALKSIRPVEKQTLPLLLLELGYKL
jgi:hypothetical protein